MIESSSTTMSAFPVMAAASSADCRSGNSEGTMGEEASAADEAAEFAAAKIASSPTATRP